MQYIYIYLVIHVYWYYNVQMELYIPEWTHQ